MSLADAVSCSPIRNKGHGTPLSWVGIYRAVSQVLKSVVTNSAKTWQLLLRSLHLSRSQRLVSRWSLVRSRKAVGHRSSLNPTVRVNLKRSQTPEAKAPISRRGSMIVVFRRAKEAKRSDDLMFLFFSPKFLTYYSFLAFICYRIDLQPIAIFSYVLIESAILLF